MTSNFNLLTVPLTAASAILIVSAMIVESETDSSLYYGWMDRIMVSPLVFILYFGLGVSLYVIPVYTSLKARQFFGGDPIRDFGYKKWFAEHRDQLESRELNDQKVTVPDTEKKMVEREAEQDLNP